MNVLVMYDRQTDTLWSQLLGEAVEGELAGKTLEYLPAWQTTWSDWKTRHPDTLALVKWSGGNRDPYSSYYRSSAPGVIGETVQDDRLSTKQYVIGVSLADDAVAYPFRVMSRETIANDGIAGRPILVVFNAESGSGVVFHREVDDKILTFAIHEGLTLIDEETQTLWDGMTGVATSGELEGRSLERVKSTSSFWFGWKDFYPDTRVYDVDE